MPSTPSIKHANHRVYQVTHEKKRALLELILATNETQKVLLLCKENAQIFDDLARENLTISDDAHIDTLSAASYDLLISFDLPSDAATYMKRIALAKEKALLLLDASEQNSLYRIEVLLGRAIKQESPEGFGYPAKEEKKRKPLQKIEPQAKRAYDKKLHEKPRNSEEKPKGEKKFFKKEGEKKPFKKSDKPFKEKGQQGKKPNKFLGYDENGKAIFSGKSGERNHRYDGKPKDAPKAAQPKKTGKTINIKELKKKEDSKES